MFKPTPALQSSKRRLALTTKQANKYYYKGNRIGNMGTFKHGAHSDYKGKNPSKFLVNYDKVRTYMVPDLSNFKLKPFVSQKIDKPKPEYAKNEGPETGKNFLRMWQEKNGVD